jgi:hypothetical protein
VKSKQTLTYQYVFIFKPRVLLAKMYPNTKPGFFTYKPRQVLQIVRQTSQILPDSEKIHKLSINFPPKFTNFKKFFVKPHQTLQIFTNFPQVYIIFLNFHNSTPNFHKFLSIFLNFHKIPQILTKIHKPPSKLTISHFPITFLLLIFIYYLKLSVATTPKNSLTIAEC